MNWQNYFFIGIDRSVSDYFFSTANARMADFFSVVTYMGNWRLVVALSGVVIFLLWKYEKKDYIIQLVVTLIGGQLTGFLLKRIFDRPRPWWGIHAGDTDSFPSGHAIVAFLFYGFLAYFIFKITEKKKERIACLTLSALIILVIGYSRLYLGAHYASDVIAGYLIGLVWMVVGLMVRKKHSKR